MSFFHTAPNVVSIVIPCLNQLHFTALCVESILHSTDFPYELIIVNNGSRDGTSKFLTLARRKIPSPAYPFCRGYSVISNTQNAGVAAALNQAISKAAGGYICYLNNDIMVAPGWLTRLVACAKRSPRIGVVGVQRNLAMEPCALPRGKKAMIKAIERNAVALSLLRDGCYNLAPGVHGCCMFIKRAVIERIGGFDERFYPCYGEDLDFSFRTLRAGFTIAVAQDVYVHHFSMRATKASAFTRKYGAIESIRARHDAMFFEKWGHAGRQYYARMSS